MTQNTPYKIIIDDRERAISTLLPAMDVTDRELCHVQRILRGDYAITDAAGGLLFIFERKTYPDYAASIRDGRSRNKEKMLDCLCRTGYIIEGAVPETDLSGISPQTIRASIDRLIFFDGIHVLYSINPLDTIMRLIAFTRAINRAEGRAFRTVDGGLLTTAPPPPTREETLTQLWTVVPRIGEMAARRLARVFSLREMICGTLSMEQLVDFSKQGGKLTKLQMGSILMGNSVAILAAIKGVGVLRARSIAEAMPNSLSSPEELARVTTGGTALGPARAQRIWEVVGSIVDNDSN